MNKREQLEELLKIENEIMLIEQFQDYMKHSHTVHKTNKYLHVFMEKKTTLSFIGKFKKEKRVELEIPKNLLVTIHIEMDDRIKELNRQYKEVLKNNIND